MERGPRPIFAETFGGGGKDAPAQAQKVSRHIEGMQGVPGEEQELYALLEKEDIAVTPELLKELFSRDSFKAHLVSLGLAKKLDKDGKVEVVTFLLKQWKRITTVGERDCEERTDEADERFYPQFGDYYSLIFKHAGEVLQSEQPDDLNAKQAEELYLELFQKYFISIFGGRRYRNARTTDDFIAKMRNDRARSIDRTFYETGDTPAESDVYWEQEYARFDEPLLPVNVAFEKLKKIGGQKSIELLTAWLQFYPEANPAIVADTMSAIDPQKAAAGLLPLLKSNDEELIRAVTRALYRLEFGQIGISQEGVRYLGKQYDVGEYNRADFEARRLTSRGQIGIFDDRKRLVRYFELQGLEKEEAHIKANILNFTVDTLFTPREQETAQERTQREQHLQEFKEKYFDFYEGEFFKDTGVQFNNLTFKEQGQLLLFYKNAGEDDRKRLSKFLQNYKEDGFRVFLSLEYGREMGERILHIGEKALPAVAKQVFRKYAEIADAAEKMREQLQAFGDTAARHPEIVDRIVEGLLRKGKDLIENWATRIEREPTRSKRNISEIKRALNNIRAEILLFAGIFKAVKSKEAVSLEEFADTEIMVSAPGGIGAKDKREMRDIFKANRPGYTPALLRATIAEFDGALNSNNAQFHVLRHAGKIVAFMRFDPLKNGNLYAGSLNVRPEVRGSALGSAMLATALDRAARRSTVEAVVYEKNPMLTHYIDDFRFEIVEELPNYKGTGQRYFKLERRVMPLAPTFPVSQARQEQAAA